MRGCIAIMERPFNRITVGLVPIKRPRHFSEAGPGYQQNSDKRQLPDSYTSAPEGV